jgi:16S rRNA (guanine(966)-N(2))-methyltransferase RsmD
VRVISGTARGRALREPSDSAIRPTGDKVKESVFNIIQFDVSGRLALDLFCGAGQLGIEALSRGASGAVFVDDSPKAIRLTQSNLALAGLSDAARVIRRDALDYLGVCGKFGLIFVDPPYDTPLADMALRKIIEFDILIENGIIICETRAGKYLPDVSPPYFKGREYKYGGTKITLFGRRKEHPDI